MALALACSDDVDEPVMDAAPDMPLDQGLPDLPAPDLAPPDLALPDLMPPDLTPPDLVPPDLTPPDLVPPDLVPPPPAHEACSKAKVLTFTAGKVSETGDTSKASNEFGSGITCGGTSPYVGPQLYYRIKLTAGKLYSVKLTPGTTFDPTLYALPISSGCTASGA